MGSGGGYLLNPSLMNSVLTHSLRLDFRSVFEDLIIFIVVN